MTILIKNHPSRKKAAFITAVVIASAALVYFLIINDEMRGGMWAIIDNLKNSSDVNF